MPHAAEQPEKASAACIHSTRGRAGYCGHYDHAARRRRCAPSLLCSATSRRVLCASREDVLCRMRAIMVMLLAKRATFVLAKFCETDNMMKTRTVARYFAASLKDVSSVSRGLSRRRGDMNAARVAPVSGGLDGRCSDGGAAGKARGAQRSEQEEGIGFVSGAPRWNAVSAGARGFLLGSMGGGEARARMRSLRLPPATNC